MLEEEKAAGFRASCRWASWTVVVLMCAFSSYLLDIDSAPSAIVGAVDT